MQNDDILSYYLWLEKQHVKFINMFINYFSVDRLGYAIFFEDLKKSLVTIFSIWKNL